jgi:hypothetical protein
MFVIIVLKLSVQKVMHAEFGLLHFRVLVDGQAELSRDI